MEAESGFVNKDQYLSEGREMVRFTLDRDVVSRGEKETLVGSNDITYY